MADRPPLVIVQGPGAVVQDVPSTDTLKVNAMAITPEGGLAVYLKNTSGGVISKGYVVRADAANDDGVILAATSDEMPIGIAYANVNNGAYGWFVVAGIADVYVDNAGTTGRNYWLGVSTATTGQCTSASASPGNTLTHFREVGHTIRSRSGAGLVRAVVHYN